MITKKITGVLLTVVLVSSFVVLPFNINGAKEVHADFASSAGGCAASAIISLIMSAMGASMAADMANSDKVPTIDSTNIGARGMKEVVMDCAAYALSKELLGSITEDVLKWVGGGSGSNAKFIVNYDDYFKRNLTNSAKTFIYDKIDNVDLPPTMKLNVKTALLEDAFGSTLNEDLAYTFPNEYQPFLEGDFSSGGWDAYAAFNQNNSFETTIKAKRALKAELAETAEHAKTRSLNNDGFLNIRKCVNQTSNGCLKYAVKTPGKLIETKVSDVLGIRLKKVIEADELNEVLTEFLSGLFTEAFKGEGLLNSSGRFDVGGDPFEFNKSLLIRQIQGKISLGSTQYSASQQAKLDQLLQDAVNATSASELENIQQQVQYYVTTWSTTPEPGAPAPGSPGGSPP